MTPVLSCTAPRFPEELKSCTRQGLSTQQRNKNLSELVVDTATREQFKEWAAQHQKFVQNSPLLSQIEKKIFQQEELQNNYGNTASFIYSSVAPYLAGKQTGQKETLFSSTSLDQAVEHRESEVIINMKFLDIYQLVENSEFQLVPDDIRRYPEIIAEYMEIEVITDGQIRALFSMEQPENKILLEDPDFMKAAYPFLEKIPPSLLVNIFSIKTKKGLLPWHSPAVLKVLMPLLEKQDFHTLEQIFSIKNKVGDSFLTSRTCFDDAELKKAAMLFDKLNNEQITNVLSIRGCSKLYPLNYYYVVKALLPRLQKLSEEQLLHVLSLESECIGYGIPLQTKVVAKEMIPLLNQLPIPQLMEILFIQNSKGEIPTINTVLKVSPSFFENEKFSNENFTNALASIIKYPYDNTRLQAAFSIFNTLKFNQLLQIFSAPDNSFCSSPVIHSLQVFKAALPLINAMTPEEQMQLLSIRNDKGETTLYTLIFYKDETVTSFNICLMEKWHIDLLVHIFSFQNTIVTTVSLFCYHTKGGIQMLAKRTPEEITRIFSIQGNTFGSTLLHSIDKLYLIIPLLNLLTEEQLSELFSIKNKCGHIPLQKEIRGNFLVEIFSKQNKEKQTLLHVPGILKIAYPLLKTNCSPEQLSQLLAICDNRGKTPLHYPEHIRPLIEGIGQQDTFPAANEKEESSLPDTAPLPPPGPIKTLTQ